MAYSELIKNFSKIREYMRQFYVYGFRSRNEFDMKSARAYDNERRRVESWLGEYMCFRQEEDGKIVFMSIDSRTTEHNPLYKAFKTKSFTDNDITFHFYILDILSDGGEYTVSQILDLFDSEYLFNFENARSFDESNVRKKMKEYVKLGIIRERKSGREVFLSLAECKTDMELWSDALNFFSEENPLGVIGSYVADRQEHNESIFRFKHNFIFTALDSQVVFDLVSAIGEECDAEVLVRQRNNGTRSIIVHPLKIYISAQNGRQYLLCFNMSEHRFAFVRIDNIEDVVARGKNEARNEYLQAFEGFSRHLWGVAMSEDNSIQKVEMTIHIGDDEEYVYHRLLREKRCGEVKRQDNNTCVFSAEVYDAREMIPFIRTFYGRIEDFYCSNDYVTEQINADLMKLQELYGGD